MEVLKITLLVFFPLSILLFSFILQKRQVKGWVIRKYIHTIGLTIAAFYGAFLNSLEEVIITLSILVSILVVLTFTRLRVLPQLFIMGTRQGERALVSVVNTSLTMSTAIILLFLLHDQPEYFMAGMLAVAFGDGLGEFIGRPFGRHKYKIIYPKSIEGSIGVFSGTFAGILISMTIFGEYQSNAILIYLFVSVIAMLIEAVSIEFVDNVLLPIVTSYSLIWLL